MSKIGKTIFFVTAVTTLSLIIFPVAAQIKQLDSGDCGEFGIKCEGNETTQSLLDYVQIIVNALLVLVGITASIYLVVGGVRYITSQGETAETEKAKNTILYAVVGLIVIGLSAMIVNYVINNVLGVGGGGATSGQQF